MTFKEAIDKIFLHQEEEDRNPGAYVSYDGLGAMVDILRELEETYAQKIKMTSEQKEEFMAFVNSPGDNFENFWFCLGSGDSLYKNKISEEDLKRAWLHPELIEVKE